MLESGTLRLQFRSEGVRLVSDDLKDGVNAEIVKLSEDSASELARSRNLIASQAREIAVLRWEIASLIKQNALTGQLTHAKYALAQRFPRLIGRVLRLKRRAKQVLSSAQSGARTPALLGSRIKILEGFEVNGPVLIADDSPIATEIARALPTASIIRVRHGAGGTRSLPVSQANEPALRPPATDSLVQLLIEDNQALGAAGAVVVEAGDDVSLGILRGRLRSGQSVILTRSTGLTASLARELGVATASTDVADLYADLPTAWLDPLDRAREPVPTIAKTMQWPKISVVMVSFNQAKFLEEGLRSVLDQGYSNLEIVVVDAVSTDGSIDILERYRSRIDVLIIEKDRGQSDGLNKGFARATGDILTWVNSDDLLEPGALFRVAQAFMHYGTDMVAGGCRQIGLTRDTLIVNHHTKLPFGMPVRLPLGLIMELEQFWLTASFFYQPEVFFTRDIWLRSGGRLREDLYYVMDYDLWLRMAAAGATIVHIPDFLACSRTHEQQKTVEGMPYMPEVQRLLQEYANRLIS